MPIDRITSHPGAFVRRVSSVGASGSLRLPGCNGQQTVWGKWDCGPEAVGEGSSVLFLRCPIAQGGPEKSQGEAWRISGISGPSRHSDVPFCHSTWCILILPFIQSNLILVILIKGTKDLKLQINRQEVIHYYRDNGLWAQKQTAVCMASCLMNHFLHLFVFSQLFLSPFLFFHLYTSAIQVMDTYI